MAARQSFVDYVRAAFYNRWNLLLLAGSTAASLLAPHPDVFLSLAAASELALLTLLASNPRFQRSIDAQTHAREDSASAELMRRRFDEIYGGLDTMAQRHFEELRGRCEVLRDLSSARGEDAAGISRISDSQLQGVNKLLWVYLKLLHTRATLEQFLRATDENEIKNLEEVTRLRLDALPKESSAAIDDRKRRSLEDTLATAAARRENFKRARENHEYVELELERIAAKLTALSELAVNRQDPSMITTGVDDVARSVEGTEQAIGELQVFTGLTQEDLRAPQILAPRQQRVQA